MSVEAFPVYGTRNKMQKYNKKNKQQNKTLN